MRLAIFDFCDTLVNFQTGNEFCRYVLKGESRLWVTRIDTFFEKFYVYRVATKLSISFLSQKRILLKGLKGLDRSKIDHYGLQFFLNVIQKNINNEVLGRLVNHIENGDVVVVNSGGYESYLKFFCDKYSIRYCFSTRFKFVYDVVTGEIDGRDCLGIEKVRQMKESDVFNIEYSEVFVYSDSPTDLPIFNLASHKVAVIKQKNIPSWCQSNFEIIKVG